MANELLIRSPVNSAEPSPLLKSPISSGRIPVENLVCSIFDWTLSLLGSQSATIVDNVITVIGDDAGNPTLAIAMDAGRRVQIGSNILWDEITVESAPSVVDTNTAITVGYGSLGTTKGGSVLLQYDNGSGQAQYKNSHTQQDLGVPFTINYPLVIHLELDGNTGDVTLVDNQPSPQTLSLGNNPDLSTDIIYPTAALYSAVGIGTTNTMTFNGGVLDPIITPSVGAKTQCNIADAQYLGTLVSIFSFGDVVLTDKEIRLEKLNGNNISPSQLATVGSFLGIAPNIGDYNHALEIELLQEDDRDLLEMDIGDQVSDGVDGGFSQLQFSENSFDNTSYDLELVHSQGDLAGPDADFKITLASGITVPIGSVLTRINENISGLEANIRYGYKLNGSPTVFLSPLPRSLGSNPIVLAQTLVSFFSSFSQDNDVYRLGLNSEDAEYVIDNYPTGTKDSTGADLTNTETLDHKAIFEDTVYFTDHPSGVNNSITNNGRTFNFENANQVTQDILSWTSRFVLPSTGKVLVCVEIGAFLPAPWVGLATRMESMTSEDAYFEFVAGGANFEFESNNSQGLLENTVIGTPSAITHLAYEIDTDNDTARCITWDGSTIVSSASIAIEPGTYMLRTGGYNTPAGSSGVYHLLLEDTIPTAIKAEAAGSTDMEGTNL